VNTARTSITTQRALSARQVAEVTGATYRQLDYWARVDVLHPSISRANGSGSRRRYSLDDARAARALVLLSAISPHDTATLSNTGRRALVDAVRANPSRRWVAATADHAATFAALDDLTAWLADAGCAAVVIDIDAAPAALGNQRSHTA
jgi:DNA-binding transcriptional MerR regulator